MEVNQKVKVKSDLKIDKRYGSQLFHAKMDKFRGQEVTISEKLKFNGYYLYHIWEELDLQNDDWGYFWTEEMFVGE